MKIVYISSSALPSRAANSIHVMKMAQAFSDLGHDVTLIGFYGDNKDADLDLYDYYGVRKCFKIIRVNFHKLPGRTIIYGIRCAFVSKNLQPDLVFTRYLAASFFVSLFKIKGVFETHAPLIPNSLDFLHRYFLIKLIKSKYLLRIVTITNFIKIKLLENYQILPEKIIVAPDGADKVQINVQPTDFELNINRLQVGYIGHLYKGRGIELIFELASLLPEMDFHIVGGNNDDINYWSKLSSNLNNFIVHGFVEPSKTQNYRAAFDVLLAPYQEEVRVSGNAGNTVQYMSPLKIFEYMSSGRAIIASDVEVLREILKSGHDSILCSPSSVKEWYDALLLLQSNRELRELLSRNALTEFENKYTWYSRARDIIEVL
jgi:glycosyltransferase involved in cell wall biosynthesis